LQAQLLFWESLNLWKMIVSQKSDGGTQVLLRLSGADAGTASNVVLGSHRFAMTPTAFRLSQITEASA
jgi:hypothetical protein